MKKVDFPERLIDLWSVSILDALFYQFLVLLHRVHLQQVCIVSSRNISEFIFFYKWNFNKLFNNHYTIIHLNSPSDFKQRINIRIIYLLVIILQFFYQRNSTTILNQNSTYDLNRMRSVSRYIILLVAWSIKPKDFSRRTETSCHPKSFNWYDSRNTTWFVSCSNAQLRKPVTYTRHCKKTTQENRNQTKIQRYVCVRGY